MIKNLTILYYFGEDRLILEKRKSLKIPYNIGIILDNQKYDEIIFNLLKLINWNLKFGVNHVNLYDPFNILSEENYKHLKSVLSILYSKSLNSNFRISNIYNSSASNEDIKYTEISNGMDILVYKNQEVYNVSLCQLFDKTDLNLMTLKNQIGEKSKLQKYENPKFENNLISEINLFKEKFKSNKKSFFILKIIGYKEANIDIFNINNIKNFEADTSLGMINFDTFNTEKNAHSNINLIENKNVSEKIDKKYLTRKETEYLPEIVISFTDSEICLYGFPFTLIENSEIM